MLARMRSANEIAGRIRGGIKRTLLARRAPGPRGTSPFGSVHEVEHDPLALFVGGFREHGDIVRFRFGYVTAHLVSHPDYVKRVLQDRHQHYGRRTRGFQALREVLGESLLTTHGDYWLRQRRISQPAFHKQRVDSFAKMMADCAEATVERWADHARTGRAFDASAEMMRLTLRIIGLSMFGIDLDDESGAIGRALPVALEYAIHRTMTLVWVPPVIPTAKNREFRAALATLNKVVLDTVSQRRASGSRGAVDHKDLLGMLLEARDEETGERMSDEQIRNELLTFLLAGHETTAMTLSWAIALLGRNPAVRRRLVEEARSVATGEITQETLRRAPYCRAVIDEALRLFPPAWIIARSADEPDEIGGYDIPKRSVVLASPFVVHRHPRYWRDPEGFDPERFLVEDPDRPRYAYFPFGGGPHQCIGMGFALLEAQIILLAIARRYDLELVPGARLQPEPLITLRPKRGIWVTARSHPA